MQSHAFRLLLWFAVTALVLVALGIAMRSPGGRSAALAPSAPAAFPSVATGKTLWGQFCASCHLPQVGVRQPLGPVLVSREYLAFATDQRLDSIISHGVAGTTMLGWGKGSSGMLNVTQVQSLVAYLRAMQPSAPSDPKWKEGRKVPLP